MLKLCGLVFIAWHSFLAARIVSGNGANSNIIEDLTAAECERLCTVVPIKAMNETCKKEFKSLPKPKLGNLCKTAFQEGYKTACNDACQVTGNCEPLKFGLERREACASATRMSPRPECRDACQNGFDAGVIAGLSSTVKNVHIRVSGKCMPRWEITRHVFFNGGVILANVA